MQLQVPLQEGEVLRSYDVYRPKPDATPYAMAVSDRALFVLARKSGLVHDPWFLKRLHISSVRAVHLKRAFPIGIYLLSGVLVLGGLAAVAFMLSPVMSGGWDSEGGAIFAVAYGLFLLYGAIGQRTILVETVEGTIKMSPPTSLGMPDKAEIRRVQDAFLTACALVGLPVADKRTGQRRAAPTEGQGGAA